MLLKNAFDKLVAEVNSIDTSIFVLKTKYDTDKTELEKKIPDTSGLVKKTDCNTKITKIEGKIPDLSNLAPKTALTTVVNKIPSVSNLVKKENITQKLRNLKRNLLIIIMINILLRQSLILQPLMFLMQDQHEQIKQRKQFLIIVYQVLIAKLLQITRK